MSISIPLFKVFMNDNIGTDIVPILTSGHITQGKKVDEFEDKLKTYFNHPYILTLNSATSGLTLALRLLDLKPSDEVLSTPLTCTATNWPVLSHNLKIKWVDVDKDTCNMDLSDLKRKISSHTKCILFVHWGGSPIDLDKLKVIAGDIPIIEDCAHAFSAEYKDRKIGTCGNISVFSLQAIKHLTTGDGGLIFLPNKDLYERAKLLRWYGISREYRSGKDFRLEHDIKEWGYKFHMNDISATIGLSNLPFINDNLKRIRENAEYYKKELKEIKGVELLKEVKDTICSYWIFTIKIINKEGFIPFMEQKGVIVSQVHNRNDIHTCVKEFKIDLPQLDKLEREIVSIPVGWWLSDKDREYIVGCIKIWCNENINKPIIRPLCISDNLKIKQEYFSILKLYPKYEVYRDFNKLLTLIQSNGTKIYLLFLQDILIGTCKVLYEQKLGDNIVHIEDVAIKKEYREKGYGKYLINEITREISKDKSVYKIVLNCKEELIGFYEKNGYKVEGVEMVIRLK